MGNRWDIYYSENHYEKLSGFPNAHGNFWCLFDADNVYSKTFVLLNNLHIFEAQFKTAWICLTLVLEWVHHWIPNDENRQNCGDAENWVRSSPANLSTCSWSILGLTLGLWAYSTSAPLSACTWPESGPLAEQCWKTWTPRCSVHTGLVWYVRQVC